MSGESARLGDLLCEARKSLGMRQEDVARAVDIGTSTYRSLERGTALGPSLYTILDLFEVLDLDPSALRDLRNAEGQARDNGA